MIDKLLLNNQIITNKKKIQQARIQTINKLVQKIRKLKQLNEKKPQNAKIAKNLEKIPQILMCLKRMKVPDIRKILTSNEKPNAVLTNGQASPEDVAIALLASNKIIAAIVETLRTLLNLNESNPGWQNEILELSRRKKKVLETVDRKKNKKKKSDTKKSTVKKLPWKEEKLDGQETQSYQWNIEAASPKGWNIEPIDKTIFEYSSMSTKVVKKKQEKEFKKTKSFFFTNEQDIADDEVEVSNNAKPVTIVDPFFFTDTGDNYLSTVVIDRAQPEPLQDGLIRRERRDNAIRPNKKNNIFPRHAASSGEEFAIRRQSIHGGGMEKGKNFDHQTNAVETKLHPSWAAKLELKPTITEFKRHKITFDNDGNDVSSAPRVKTFKTNLTEENLHPSWAAKQKLKPTIAEFKGRKITFDNDGNDVEPSAQKFNQSNKRTDKSNAPSLEGIHPSWAAKQKQKPTITEFKGTKITFHD